MGPVGSGKSLAACWEWFLLCQESTVPLRGLVLRESWPQLRDSTLKTYLEWFDSVSDYKIADHILYLTIPNFEGTVLRHELHLRHAQRAAEASKFLSTEYAFIWLEEVTPAFQAESGVIGMGLPEEIFQICLMRQRQKGAHHLELILTFNPPPRHHWAYEIFYKPSRDELEKKSFARFDQPPFENEQNLPKGYYKKLIQWLSPDLARRFVKGEVVTLYPGRRVFEHFAESLHCVEGLRPIKGIDLTLAFDFGLTPVCLICQVLPNARLLILEEAQLWDAGIERLAERVISRMKQPRYFGLKFRNAWGDPHGVAKAETDEKSCFDILAAKGLPVSPGAIDFTTRRESVDQRCERMIDGKPALLIDRHRCPVLTEGMLGGYRYPKSRDGQLQATPMKNEFSHACDALQYLCSGEFSVTTGGAKMRPQKRSEKIPRFDPFASSPRRSRQLSWMSQ